MMLFHQSYSTLRISPVVRSRLWAMAMEACGDMLCLGLMSQISLYGEADPQLRYSATQKMRMTKISLIFLGTTTLALVRKMRVIEVLRMALELSCYILSSQTTHGLVMKTTKMILLHRWSKD